MGKNDTLVTKNFLGANKDRWRRLVCRQAAVGLVRKTNENQDQERHLGIGKVKKQNLLFFN